jgi:ABC-type transport system substrate-binding protein
MREEANFWTRRRVSRRAALRGAGVGVAGLAGAALIGCGDDDDDDTGAAAPAAAGTAQAAATAAPAGTAAAAAAPEAQKAGGVMKSWSSLDADTFDVQTATSYKTAAQNAWAYSRLIGYDLGRGDEPAPGSVTGDLVETREQPDELTHVFKLRPGVKWDARPPTSGRILNSEDVTLTWAQYKETHAYRKTLVNDVSENASIKTIEAVDDLTLEMKIAFPDASVLPGMAWYLTGIWIYPREAFDGSFNPANDMRGTGTWLLDEYSPAVKFRYKKNPDWFGGPELPYFDAVERPIIEGDPAQAEAQFRAKNIYMGGPLPQNYPIIVKEVPGTEIVTGGPTFGSHMFGMNRIPGSGFNDIRVRHALSMSLDRDTFNEVINDPAQFEDVGITLNTYWNTPLSAGYGSFWLDPKGPDFGPSAKYLQHDVAEAKRLLAAAGYDDNDPFEFDLIFPGTRYGRDWPARAETWQAMAAEAGIKAHLWVVDYTTEWIAKPPTGVFRSFSIFEGRDGRKSAVTYRPSSGDPTADLWLVTAHHSAGANNEVGDNYPKLDAMIEEARRISDYEQLVAKIHDIQRHMMEDQTTIPVLPTVDSTTIKWEGLHGPGEIRTWGGGVMGGATSVSEIWPEFWLDDSLKA